MMDTETKTQWSHILGRAMKGRLKGRQLEAIPADMVTWSAWKRDFPDTTVLALKRTRHHEYTDEFYQDPRNFVVGFSTPAGPRHCSFATLVKQAVLNVDAGELPLVISFDRASTSARIFVRELDGAVLKFQLDGNSLSDIQTGSHWNRVTGEAISGSSKGKRLKSHVGIVSYAEVWKTFHPDSKAVLH